MRSSDSKSAGTSDTGTMGADTTGTDTTGADTTGTGPKGLFTRWVTRPIRQQSMFSWVSALLALMHAITLFVEIIFARPGFDIQLAMPLMLTYLLLALIPLLLGRNFRWWLGLVLPALLVAAASVRLANSDEPAFVLFAVLELPILGIYFGWFFVPWVARTAIVVGIIGITAGIHSGPQVEVAGFSQNLALTYSVVLALLCLEVARYLRRETEQEARRDPLTGALNRRGFTRLGREIVLRAHRNGLADDPITLVAIDFDGLKELNDADGHAAGDTALVESVEVWQRYVGPLDLVARIGGDEFVLLIQGEEAIAQRILARCRRRSRNRWSWGVATLQSGEALGDLLHRADEQLYLSKAEKKT